MRVRSKVLVAVCGAALVTTTAAAASAAQPTPPAPPDAMVDGVARDLHITQQQARTRLVQQDEAHRVAKSLPRPLRARLAGMWFDDKTGKLTVAVTDQEAADAARVAGAEPRLVSRSQAELDRLVTAVRTLAGARPHGLRSFGIDPVGNDVTVKINRMRRDASTGRFIEAARLLGAGVRVVEVNSSLVQQSGEVNPGDPWWPGGESNCSVGFGATDANGGKHFVTAGHCTDNANQPAYGQSGQQNRIGTSNVGGTRSVNGQGWQQVTVPVTGGHGYTLTLVNRDDNHPDDPVNTLYDDVSFDAT